MTEEIVGSGYIRQGTVVQVQPEPKDQCAFPAMHHSDDRVTVFHGREEGTVLCGFHASYEWLPEVLNTLYTKEKV